MSPDGPIGRSSDSGLPVCRAPLLQSNLRDLTVMKALVTILRVFGYTWLSLGFILIVVGIAGVWMKSGFSAVQDLMSPFNVVNYLAMIVTLAPGIGSLAWADKLQQKLRRRGEREHQSIHP